MHPDDVADLYDVGRSTVYNWRKEYQEKGPAALKVKNAPGRTPRLTDEQRDRLRKLVVGRDPRQLQFEFALWTRQMVRELIKREFGVDYTPEAVGNILHDLGLSPQRPLYARFISRILNGYAAGKRKNTRLSARQPKPQVGPSSSATRLESEPIIIPARPGRRSARPL